MVNCLWLFPQSQKQKTSKIQKKRFQYLQKIIAEFADQVNEYGRKAEPDKRRFSVHHR